MPHICAWVTLVDEAAADEPEPEPELELPAAPAPVPELLDGSVLLTVLPVAGGSGGGGLLTVSLVTAGGALLLKVIALENGLTWPLLAKAATAM